MTWLQDGRLYHGAGRRGARRALVAGIIAATLTTLGFSAAGAQSVVFNEIRVKQTNGATDDQIVELKNTSASSIDVGGWIFCHQFDYSSVLPNGTTIPAGGLLLVHFNAIGTNTASAVFFPDDVLDSVTDLALYDKGTVDFSNSSKMRSFIQFGGNPGIGRQNVADQAGLWTQNTFVPSVANGNSIELCAANATSANSYVPQSAPTFGQQNGCGVAVEAATWSKLKSIYN